MKHFKKFLKKHVMLFCVLIIAGFTGWIYLSTQSPTVAIINNFEECVGAGYPVMESYPEQCKTGDGRTFTRQVESPQQEGNKVRIKGEIVCLPHKDRSGPQTLECAYGLKAEDGKHYALGYSDPDALHLTSLPTGEVVVVEGNLEDQTDGKYDIVGAIDVTSIEK